MHVSRQTRSRRRPAVIAVTAATALVAAGVWIANGASAGTLSGNLYRDPNSAAVKWVAANSGDSRAAVIRDKIASQPAFRWVANYNPSTVQSETSSFVSAANSAGQ